MSKLQLYPNTGNRARTLIPIDGIALDAVPGDDAPMNSVDALRRNLTTLMDAARDGLISGPDGVLQLEAYTDVGKSTLYRILDPREPNPPRLDTLERIAAAYNLQVWQLLVPRLEPLDPPECVGSRQMTVLRSVFAQTQIGAFGHASDTGRAASHGASPPDNRVRGGGHPAEPTPVGDRHIPKRHRRK